LDEFHAHLTNGIEKVRDKIADVVPQWQAILRRIVQEPRFSGTNLNYYKSRNRDHASVEVGLGSGNVGVADVASQAQMTDLQLSFMLAMAMVHQWSPWKALLLDDPTQHHDLVHASSVFDVLRDFIAEHGFQVVLTTHDAQQARFLMRKLSNDGIDARLWTLEPSLNGMTAKQIGGRA
jgi:energy-coupling factor transporter ATP-binding protein EcfA2